MFFFVSLLLLVPGAANDVFCKPFSTCVVPGLPYPGGRDPVIHWYSNWKKVYYFYLTAPRPDFLNPEYQDGKKFDSPGAPWNTDLVIYNFTESDTGPYRLFISTSIDSSEYDINVTIADNPRVILERANSTFTCFADSTRRGPKPTKVTWTVEKHGTKVEFSESPPSTITVNADNFAVGCFASTIGGNFTSEYVVRESYVATEGVHRADCGQSALHGPWAAETITSCRVTGAESCKAFCFRSKEDRSAYFDNRLMYRYLPNPSNGSVESIENRPESAIRPSDGLGCITGGSCMRILLGLGLMLATVLAIAMGAFWHMKRTRKSWSPQSIEQYDHRGSLLPIRSPRPQRQQKDSL